MSDEAVNLWQRVKNDDLGAFEKIYESYSSMLKNYACNYLHDTYRADDAVQNLFVELYEHRKKISISKNLPAYLCIVLRRQIMKNLLDENRYVSCIESISNTLLCDTISLECIANEKDDLIVDVNSLNVSIVRYLSGRQKEIIHLKYFENLTNEEIALKLGICCGTVRNLSSRAIKSIRRGYDKKMKYKMLTKY